MTGGRRIGRVLAAAALFCGAAAGAHTADSTVVRTSDRGVMLNAESATAPRVLNIGLPESTTGAVIFVDGMRAGHGLPRSYFHWAGGNAYRKTANYSLMEAVVRFSEFSSPVNSWTKLGGDTAEGVVTARTSSNGLIRFDGYMGGPLKGFKGWYYSLGAYVNYDPSSVNSPSCTFVDRKQIYQLNLSKRWASSELDIMYRFSWCGDQIEGLYNTAPFIYNGDGSVTVMDGFRMGYDCYMPSDDKVRYMDVITGDMRNLTLNGFNDRRMHDITMLWKRQSAGGWLLKASLHSLLTPQYDQINASLNGIDKVGTEKGYTLTDGTPYQGYVQNRMVKADSFHTYDNELRLEAEKKFRRHEISTGVSMIYADQFEEASSFTFAHTAEASPSRLYLGGKDVWNLNRNALYFDAVKASAFFFVFDKWKLSDSFSVLTGASVKPIMMFIHTAARLDDEAVNRRVEGFNLADPSLAKVHYIEHGGFDYAVSESLNWSFAPGFQAVAEGFYSMTNKTTTYFKNASIPSLKAIGNAHVRAGVTYANQWMSIAGILSYITSWNNAASISVTKQIGGISETIPWVAQYGIGTPGATLDGNFFAGGFKCHALVTWQDPRYHNYTNVFVFSDNSTAIRDYTGKNVTGISRVMVELDPSYKWKTWRVWCSTRYFSRRYANRTNLVYFNGRIETFGGIDWDWRKDCKISLSFVNLLGQGGVKGSIESADTMDDASELVGYRMAGTFIRPFSVDLSMTVNF